MKLDYDRLAEHLAQTGFSRGYPTRNVASASFVRQSTLPNLYESISFGAAGRDGEAVFAEIGTSVIKTVTYKRLGDVRILTEVASDKARGWTVVKSPTAARKWEDEVLSVAPQACQTWTTAVGTGIWQRNQEGYAQLDRYRRTVPLGVSPKDIYKSLEAGLNDFDSARAEAIFENGGRGVRGTEIAHKIACMILAMHVKTIEPERVDLQTQTPLTNVELMDRVFVLADSFIQIPFTEP